MDLERIEALERLAELKRQGLLTDAEFEAEKNRILSDGPAPIGHSSDEDEPHRPAIDQPAPPPEPPEKSEADLQPPVIEEHNVEEQPLEPEAEDSQSSSRGEARKPTSAQASPEDSSTTTAAQARARFEKRRKKQQRKKRRRTLVGALALIAIAAIGAVTITNRDSNPSPGIEGSPSAATNENQSITTTTHAPSIQQFLATTILTTTVLDLLSALPKAMIDGTILSPSDIDHRMFGFLPFETVRYSSGINSAMPYQPWLVPFCNGLGWMAQSLRFKDASGLALMTDRALWEEALDHDDKVPHVRIQITAFFGVSSQAFTDVQDRIQVFAGSEGKCNTNFYWPVDLHQLWIDRGRSPVEPYSYFSLPNALNTNLPALEVFPLPKTLLVTKLAEQIDQIKINECVIQDATRFIAFHRAYQSVSSSTLLMSTGSSDSQSLLYIDDLNVALHFSTNIGLDKCVALDFKTHSEFIEELIRSGTAVHNDAICIGLNAFLVAASLSPTGCTPKGGM
jgi:hypothetical protein